MKNLLNVVKGYIARENVEKLNIIDIEKMVVVFCGDMNMFVNPPDFMSDHQREVCRMQVIKSQRNGQRLDLFVK